MKQRHTAILKPAGRPVTLPEKETAELTEGQWHDTTGETGTDFLEDRLQ